MFRDGVWVDDKVEDDLTDPEGQKYLPQELLGVLQSEYANDPVTPEPGKGKNKNNGRPPVVDPVLLTVDQILAIKAPERRMLIETILQRPGVVLMVGSHKAGKTVLAVQMAIAVASGHALMDNYSIASGQGAAVIIVEQDDSAGDVSVRDYLSHSPIPVRGCNILLATRIDKYFGVDFLRWLELEIRRHQAQFVVLDSYVALRPHRKPGGDVVKIEADELLLLDRLGIDTDCTISVLHHISGGRINNKWSDQAGGSYGVGAANQGMIHICRYEALSDTAPERLLRGRTRHGDGFSAVLRFRQKTLDHELVMEGIASPFYPEIRQLRRLFQDQTFTAKTLLAETGLSRAVAYRLLGMFVEAGVLTRSHGEYRFDPSFTVR